MLAGAGQCLTMKAARMESTPGFWILTIQVGSWLGHYSFEAAMHFSNPHFLYLWSKKGIAYLLRIVGENAIW